MKSIVKRREYPPHKMMLPGKYLKIKKIKELEKQLKEEFIENGLKRRSGFCIMFNEEEGKTIDFVRDMPIECTGSMKESYDKKSPYFNPEYKDIGWPYTGFVQGNILGLNPISIPNLVEWLEFYGYNIGDFIKGLGEKQ